MTLGPFGWGNFAVREDNYAVESCGGMSACQRELPACFRCLYAHIKILPIDKVYIYISNTQVASESVHVTHMQLSWLPFPKNYI